VGSAQAIAGAVTNAGDWVNDKQGSMGVQVNGSIGMLYGSADINRAKGNEINKICFFVCNC